MINLIEYGWYVEAGLGLGLAHACPIGLIAADNITHFYVIAGAWYSQ